MGNENYLRLLKSPISVHLELTRQCNFKCFYCSITDNTVSIQHFSLQHFKKIIDEINKAGVFELSFSGGEPFLSPYIYKLAEYAKNKGLITAFLSNGLSVKKKDFKVLSKVFNGGGFSLNGVGDIHDRMVGVNGAFKHIIKIINLLKQEKFIVGINCLVSKFNINHLSDFLKWVSCNLSVDFIAINFFHSYNGNVANEIITLEDFNSAINVIDFYAKNELKEKISLGVPIPHCLFSDDKKYLRTSCSAGFTFGSVDSFGNVRMCPSSSVIVGNILKKSLISIWRKSDELKFFRSRSWIEPICKKCAAKKICFSGCKVTSSNLYYSLPEQWKPYINPIKVTSDKIILDPINNNNFVNFKDSDRFFYNSHTRFRKENFGYLAYSSIYGIHWINKSAMEIFDMFCNKNMNVIDVVKKMVNIYDVNFERAKKDIETTLYKFIKIKIITPKNVNTD